MTEENRDIPPEEFEDDGPDDHPVDGAEWLLRLYSTGAMEIVCGPFPTEDSDRWEKAMISLLKEDLARNQNPRYYSFILGEDGFCDQSSPIDVDWVEEMKKWIIEDGQEKEKV